MIHKAHVTEEFTRDAVVIQVRRTSRDADMIGYVGPPLIGDTVPTMEAVLVRPLEQETVEAITVERGHAPGIRFSHQDAVAIHEALGEYLGHYDRLNAAKLAEAEQRANDAELALAVAQEKIRGLEEAAGADRHHLSTTLATAERERQTVDLERNREAQVRTQLDGLAQAYQNLQAQAQAMQEAATSFNVRVPDPVELCRHQAPNDMTLCSEYAGHPGLHAANGETWDNDGLWHTRH